MRVDGVEDDHPHDAGGHQASRAEIPPRSGNAHAGRPDHDAPFQTEAEDELSKVRVALVIRVVGGADDGGHGSERGVQGQRQQKRGRADCLDAGERKAAHGEIAPRGMGRVFVRAIWASMGASTRPFQA